MDRTNAHVLLAALTLRLDVAYQVQRLQLFSEAITNGLSKKTGRTTMLAEICGFDNATGAAVVTSNHDCWRSTPEQSLHVLRRLGPTLRVVVLHSSDMRQIRRAARSEQHLQQVHDALRALGVPIVCSGDWQTGDMRLADYCVANMSSVRTARLGHRDC